MPLRPNAIIRSVRLKASANPSITASLRQPASARTCYASDCVCTLTAASTMGSCYTSGRVLTSSPHDPRIRVCETFLRLGGRLATVRLKGIAAFGFTALAIRAVFIVLAAPALSFGLPVAVLHSSLGQQHLAHHCQMKGMVA